MRKNRGFLDLTVLKEVIQLSQNFLLCKHIKKRNKRNIKNKDNQIDTINKKRSHSTHLTSTKRASMTLQNIHSSNYNWSTITIHKGISAVVVSD